MEMIMDALTDLQRSALKQFKECLVDILTPEHTDTILIKWLRARNYNVKASERIFREMYNNRILFEFNTILETYEKPEVAEKYESLGFLGFAKDGSLIRYTGAGRIDFYGFIMSMSSYDSCRYFAHMMESDIHALKEENLRTGRNVEEILFIVDLEEFSIQEVLHKNVIEISLEFIRLLQDCYPEIWSHVLIVNAPFIFHKVFNFLKPVLRGPALERMKVINKDSTRSVLLEYIDEDVLPAFLGGTRVDSNADPYCKEFIKFGGKIPEEFYIQNRSSAALLTPDDLKTTAFILGPRSVRNISARVDQGGTIAMFKMKAENGSVELAVFYKEFGDDPSTDFPRDNEYLDQNDENCRFQMISVTLKAQIHCTPMDLKVLLPKPGIYVIRFSNAGNWFTSRKVMVQYYFIPPSTYRKNGE